MVMGRAICPELGSKELESCALANLLCIYWEKYYLLSSFSLSLSLKVGTQFKNSLSSLLEILISKEPSYIRCIKPNDRKEPSES